MDLLNDDDDDDESTTPQQQQQVVVQPAPQQQQQQQRPPQQSQQQQRPPQQPQLRIVPPATVGPLPSNTTTVRPSTVQPPQSSIARPPAAAPSTAAAASTSRSVPDVLASLIKANTRSAHPDDIALAQHVRTCTNDKPCPTANCDQGKERMDHYKQCRDPKCFICVLGRLVAARDQGRAASNLDGRVIRSRQELQEHLRRVKKSVDDLAEAKKAKQNMLIMETEGRLHRLKDAYQEAKLQYETICGEVYEKWSLDHLDASGNVLFPISPPKQPTPPPTKPAAPIVQPPQQQPRPVQPTQQPGPRPSPPHQQQPAPRPSQSQAAAANNTKPVAVAAATVAPAVPPQPAPVPPAAAPPPAVVVPAQPPRKYDEIDGFHVQYVFGDGLAKMTSALDAVSEDLTNTIVTEADDWASKRGVTETRESDWGTRNVLSRSEIELEQQRKGKRLFSGREVEFLSRAAQELTTDILAECIQLAKHRKLTCEGQQDGTAQKKVTVTMKDLQLVLQRQSVRFSSLK